MTRLTAAGRTVTAPLKNHVYNPGAVRYNGTVSTSFK